MSIKFTKKPLIIAVCALLSSGAFAATDDELKELRAAVKSLQQEVQTLRTPSPAPVAAHAAPAPGTEPIPENLSQRLTSVEMKIDDMRAADVDGGPLSGLSITGYVDMLYSVNQASSSNGFVMMNQSNSYGYDTSNRGDVFLDIKKSFGSGPMAPNAEITIMPTRGAGRTSSFNDQGAYNQSIINTAQLNYPVSPNMTVFGGTVNSFAGYEYPGANQSPLITHGLLYDFGEPSLLTGVGFSGWTGVTDIVAWRAFVGNAVGQSSPLNINGLYKNQAPVITGRLDYQFNSTSDIGISALFGKNSPVNYPATFATSVPTLNQSENVSYVEVDYSYTRLDDSWFAQVDYGQNDHAAANGGLATWAGFSLMRSAKFNNPTLGWMGWSVRYDYLDNSANGGGTTNTYMVDLVQGKPTDTANGFGIGADCYANNGGAVGNCSGAIREALTFGLQFYPHKQLTLKSELRFDRASENTFYFATDGSYRNTNTVFSLQGVYSF